MVFRLRWYICNIMLYQVYISLSHPGPIRLPFVAIHPGKLSQCTQLQEKITDAVDDEATGEE